MPMCQNNRPVGRPMNDAQAGPAPGAWEGQIRDLVHEGQIWHAKMPQRPPKCGGICKTNGITSLYPNTNSFRPNWHMFYPPSGPWSNTKKIHYQSATPIEPLGLSWVRATSGMGRLVFICMLEALDPGGFHNIHMYTSYF